MTDNPEPVETTLMSVDLGIKGRRYGRKEFLVGVSRRDREQDEQLSTVHVVGGQ